MVIGAEFENTLVPHGGGVGVAVGVGVGVGSGVGDGGGVAPGVGVTAGPVMLKFVSEISKKILPIASTLIRAVVVGVLGIVSDSVPSLAVLAESTVGNVLPPSVEREILTFATLTGASVVLATSQVIV
jgi:hypothetical protein